ncbi:MAG: dihydroxyacetone kinase phosphoryl donor subunit DhaM [Microbacteriaceae bacterium]
MTVGLVVVSHSARIAAGVVELAAQMAAEVTIAEAGGTEDGGIGTSFDLVQAAIERADSGDGAVLLCDLGSAVLTAETALDFLDDEQRMRVRIAEAPIVEGAVAAAVAAATGAGLEAVLAAAESANGTTPASARPGAAAATGDADSALPTAARTVTLVNRDGLHARPAAEFVKLAAGSGAEVTVQGADARSLLAVMALGLTRGAELRIEARGPGAQAAVDALAELVESGFGEP